MKYFFSLFIVFSILINPINSYAAEIVLAGGCFWCLEHDLESLNGVKTVLSGYSGGDLPKPTYENHVGHQEVVLVNYDSNIISYSNYQVDVIYVNNFIFKEIKNIHKENITIEGITRKTDTNNPYSY